MSTLRVLMVAACPLPWPRGTPIRVHRMAEALHRLGHDVTVVTYPLGDLATAVPYRVVRVAPRAAMTSEPGPTLRKLLYLDPLLCRATVRLLRGGAFDVVHAHHYEGLLAALGARAVAGPVPIVYDAHTLLASELPEYRLPLPRRALAAVGAALDRRLPRRADHIISVSDRMYEYFTGTVGIAPGRVTVIANGVEHEHFRVPAAAQHGDGTSTGGPPEAGRPAVRIAFAGNLAAYQGIDLLLEAFARVRQARPDAELLLVTGSDPAPLQGDLNRLGLNGAVRMVDADYASLPRRLADADVLANPRVHCDGLPQKLLNYMAAGRPIVSFAGSAALLVHESTGLVVPDGDTDAFAAAVLRLLDDPALAERLGDAARCQVVAEHGWGQVAERVTEVYDRLTGSRA
jgi:glycosyltransferase involved in cell wall biosynthesis